MYDTRDDDCIKISEIELYSFQHNTQFLASAVYKGDRIAAGSGKSEQEAIYDMEKTLKEVIWRSWEPAMTRDLNEKGVKKV